MNFLYNSVGGRKKRPNFGKKRLKTDQKIAKKKTLADQFFQIFRKKTDLTILSWSKIRLKLIN